MTDIEEQAICLRGDEVRAILRGILMQTQVVGSLIIRPVKPNLFYGAPDWDRAWIDGPPEDQYIHVSQSGGKYGEPTIQRVWPPFGAPATTMWCSEKWAVESSLDTVKPKDIFHCPVWFDADNEYYSNSPRFGFDTKSPRGKWRSPTHMPRWASRLDWMVGSNKVLRVQQLRFDQCLRAGIDGSCSTCGATAGQIIERFQTHWNLLYKQPGLRYSDNPYVFLSEIADRQHLVM